MTSFLVKLGHFRSHWDLNMMTSFCEKNAWIARRHVVFHATRVVVELAGK